MDSPSQHDSHTSLVVIQPPAVEGRQRLDYDRDTQPATILSLDQIKAIRGSNEYTEGPSVARRPTQFSWHLLTALSLQPSAISPQCTVQMGHPRTQLWIHCAVLVFTSEMMLATLLSPPPAPSIREGLPFAPPTSLRGRLDTVVDIPI
ncbi:rCG41526, isoform CRA_b [Rattus norvegicus]|uniref:RCG41526, isoform CRA_b n=1 Tax=Rattus norvegicus TaxID=10116 RepID=A6II17_RAT|nr:rCG41526, isoform CRA_b [Rattus norvegicus]|eukprot:NP_001099897.1 protein sprouty homolog 1 [Rattus norvegicus]